MPLWDRAACTGPPRERLCLPVQRAAADPPAESKPPGVSETMVRSGVLLMACILGLQPLLCADEPSGDFSLRLRTTQVTTLGPGDRPDVAAGVDVTAAVAEVVVLDRLDDRCPDPGLLGDVGHAQPGLLPSRGE